MIHTQNDLFISKLNDLINLDIEDEYKDLCKQAILKYNRYLTTIESVSDGNIGFITSSQKAMIDVFIMASLCKLNEIINIADIGYTPYLINYGSNGRGKKDRNSYISIHTYDGSFVDENCTDCRYNNLSDSGTYYWCSKYPNEKKCECKKHLKYLYKCKINRIILGYIFIYAERYNPIMDNSIKMNIINLYYNLNNIDRTSPQFRLIKSKIISDIINDFTCNFDVIKRINKFIRLCNP